MKCCGVGEYKCSKILTIPDKMKGEYTKIQFCDKCIYDEIQGLLNAGVITEASCCGHNEIKPTVVTDELSFLKMVNRGYKLLRQIGKHSDEWELKTEVPNDTQ